MDIRCNQVIDLNKFNINNLSTTETFYLDTNIWYWFTYVEADLNVVNEKYSETVSAIHKSDSAILMRSKLTYGELAHIIEADHFKKYRAQIKLKAFRSVQDERKKVVEDIKLSITQMDRMVISNGFVEDMNKISKDDFFGILDATELDGTDMLMALSVQKNQIQNIITDDGDYATIPNINMYTYNPTVINSARKVGKCK